MGKVGQRRRQERDRRAGRTWIVDATNRPVVPGPAPADGYVALAAKLDRLRSALAADRFTPRPSIEVQRDQADLERALGDAIGRAFAADARGSAVPVGVSSWAGEGLARCDERERLLFATQ